MHDEETKTVCCWRCDVREGVRTKILPGQKAAFVPPAGWAAYVIDIESTVFMCGDCFEKEEEVGS